jgi:hypothetical protein
MQIIVFFRYKFKFLKGFDLFIIRNNTIIINLISEIINSTLFFLISLSNMYKNTSDTYIINIEKTNRNIFCLFCISYALR